MKNSIFFMSAVLVLAAMSCDKEEYDEIKTEGQRTVFSAAAPGAMTPDLKSVLGVNADSGKPQSKWQNGDAIVIRNNQGAQPTFTTTLETDSFTAAFSSSEEFINIHKGVVAVYPATSVSSITLGTRTVKARVPQIQTAVEGSYDPAAAVAVAYSTTSQLQFRNAVALLKFTVGSDRVTRVKFSGNNDDVVYGTMQAVLTEENEIDSVTAGNTTGKEVILYAGEGKTLTPGSTYYLAIIPGAFEKGFSVQLQIGGTYYKVKNLDTAYPIDRNEILDIGELKYENYGDVTLYFKASNWNPELTYHEGNGTGPGFSGIYTYVSNSYPVEFCCPTVGTVTNYGYRGFRLNSATGTSLQFNLDKAGMPGWIKLPCPSHQRISSVVVKCNTSSAKTFTIYESVDESGVGADALTQSVDLTTANGEHTFGWLDNEAPGLGQSVCVYSNSSNAQISILKVDYE